MEATQRMLTVMRPKAHLCWPAALSYSASIGPPGGSLTCSEHYGLVNPRPWTCKEATAQMCQGKTVFWWLLPLITFKPLTQPGCSLPCLASAHTSAWMKQPQDVRCTELKRCTMHSDRPVSHGPWQSMHIKLCTNHRVVGNSWPAGGSLHDWLILDPPSEALARLFLCCSIADALG